MDTYDPNVSPAPFVLTPRLVAEKALPLLIEGKLLKQLFPDSRCKYRGQGDAPCVVGGALPDAVARYADAIDPKYGSTVDELAEIDVIECSDVRTLAAWQSMHDNGEFDTLRAALEAELAKGA